MYRQVSNIRRSKSKNLKRFSSRLAVVCAQSIEARCWVENEDVVGAVPTGDAPTTSEWSTILLPIKARLILEVLWYFPMSHGITGWVIRMIVFCLSASMCYHHIPAINSLWPVRGLVDFLGIKGSLKTTLFGRALNEAATRCCWSSSSIWKE